MEHVIIGLIVGLVMGLSGAGGALISIPMFLAFLNMGLKEATVLSLVSVLLGTVVNLIGPITRIDTKLVFGVGILGTAVNYLTLQIKELTPDWVIAFLLSAISLYSLTSIWRSERIQQNFPEKKGEHLKILFTGFILGLVTTLTGLGGGVLMVPLLIRFFGKTYQEALPTSLATIFIISLSALILQRNIVIELISLRELGLIGAGTMIGFVLLKILSNRLTSDRLIRLRQIVFSFVTIYAIGSVLSKVF